MHSAHRVAWEIANGSIPDGLFVLHHCDNRACVNPEHLFLGTNWDNIRDMRAKGRDYRMMKPRSELIRSLVEPELGQQLRRAAEEQDRSLSYTVRAILAEWAKEQRQQSQEAA
jgi:hypothetical protein